jgi:hypothetical protein
MIMKHHVMDRKNELSVKLNLFPTNSVGKEATSSDVGHYTTVHIVV